MSDLNMRAGHSARQGQSTSIFSIGWHLRLDGQIRPSAGATVRSGQEGKIMRALFSLAVLLCQPAWNVMAEPAEYADVEHSYRATDTTYSIIAVDKETGQLGLGVQSKALSIGNRVVTGKGGVAIVAHQSSSNPMYGKVVIDGIERGMTPQQALEFALRADKEPDRRQVAVIDIQGRS